MQQPNFAYQPGTSDLTLRPSEEALATTRRRKAVSSAVKSPEAVRREARDRVVQKGGDPTDRQQVLAESELQLGQYRGQTFRWLLENDVGYAVNHRAHEEARARASQPGCEGEALVGFGLFKEDTLKDVSESCAKDRQG